MSAVTTFLIVMIISLGIGNAMFFLLRRKRPLDAPHPIGHAGELGDAGPSSWVGEAAADIGAYHHVPSHFSAAPMQKKIELAHARLQALESKFRAMQGVYEDSLKGRVEKLEAFRDTANAEIIAVKEILEGMRNGSSGAAQDSAQAAKGDIQAEELRRLIYTRSKA